jgi:hypothetical protein
MPRKEFQGRYTSVYFNTPEEMTKWEAKAQLYNVTLSKLISEALNLLDKQVGPRPDLVKKVSEQEEEITHLQKELRIKTALLERYESDLFKLTNVRFAELDMDTGDRQYSQKLIAIMRDGKVHDGYAIFMKLGVNPQDTEACKFVKNQLLSLERYGLVAETQNGWRWLG